MVRPVGEVLARVIEDVVCAERPDPVQLRGTAHAGDLGSEGLGDLHGEGAYAAGGSDDQHLVAGSDSSVVADRLERREPGNRDRSRLIEGDVRRLGCELVGPGAHVLSE